MKKLLAIVAVLAAFQGPVYATDLEDMTITVVAAVLCQKTLLGTPVMETILSKVEMYPEDSRIRAGAMVKKMVRDIGPEKFCELTGPALSELSKLR